MDINAETSAEIFRLQNVLTMIMDVSNPATSSYIRVRNETTGRLRLLIFATMGNGTPTVGSAPIPHSANGETFNIEPGQESAISFHNHFGRGHTENTWVTDFRTISGSPERQRTFRITVVNAPGGMNWTTVQVIQV